MQRPSFALAVLFGALASGLLVANVAPCQVIVVFHDVRVSENAATDPTPNRPENSALPEYAPADQPAASAPPPVAIDPAPATSPMPAEAVSSENEAQRNDSPAPVTLAPVAEAGVVSPPTIAEAVGTPLETTPVITTAPATPVVSSSPTAEASLLPQWLEVGNEDPADAMPPVDAVAAAPSEVADALRGISESAQAAPAEQAEAAERAELVENIAKKFAEAKDSNGSPEASPPVSPPVATIIEDRPANDERPTSTPESAVETFPAMSLEPLRDAARGVAVTLDDTADWVHALANGLRTWVDRDVHNQTP